MAMTIDQPPPTMRHPNVMRGLQGGIAGQGDNQQQEEQFIERCQDGLATWAGDPTIPRGRTVKTQAPRMTWEPLGNSKTLWDGEFDPFQKVVSLNFQVRFLESIRQGLGRN